MPNGHGLVATKIRPDIMREESVDLALTGVFGTERLRRDHCHRPRLPWYLSAGLTCIDIICHCVEFKIDKLGRYGQNKHYKFNGIQLKFQDIG